MDGESVCPSLAPDVSDRESEGSLEFEVFVPGVVGEVWVGFVPSGLSTVGLWDERVVNGVDKSVGSLFIPDVSDGELERPPGVEILELEA